jgi:hypothetical protein
VTRQQPDLDAVARAILDAIHDMTLGTADAAGRPWVSPVFFAAQHWVLDPDAAPDQRTPVNP